MPFGNNRIIIILVCVLYIRITNSWSWNPICLITECCNNDDIIDDVNKLRATIRSKVYGQHLVEIAVHAIEGHLRYKPQKPLTLSFHGWPGSGKNYVSSFIAESLYKKGVKSKYVHTFVGRVHFPEVSHSSQYRDNLYRWLKGNLTACPKQLFIFDEVDKMPQTVLNAIKPMVDYRGEVDKVDYTQAIFIFLSNTGSDLINQHYHDMWQAGKHREDMKLSDFETLISQGAFNEVGGFHHGDVIKHNLIDHYIPFLPMQENHVKQCIVEQFVQRGVPRPSNEHIDEVLEFVDWGPEETKLFSKTGCKRISSKVSLMVSRYYPTRGKHEL